jgi:hypothetical protein
VHVACATPALAIAGVSTAPEPLPKIVTIWPDAAPDIPADIQTTANMLNQILLINISSCRMIGVAKRKTIKGKHDRPGADLAALRLRGLNTARYRPLSNSSVDHEIRGI